MRVSFSNANNKEEIVAADHGKTKSTIPKLLIKLVVKLHTEVFFTF